LDKHWDLFHQKEINYAFAGYPTRCPKFWVYKYPSHKAPAGRMKLIHYQTLESIGPEEFQALRRIKEQFNEGRGFWKRIKLWRKSDLLEGLEPRESRWGFTRIEDEQERLRLLLTIKRMSEATPGVTWVVYDESNGGTELVIRAGRVVSGTS
jgi:hypothetical protein